LLRKSGQSKQEARKNLEDPFLGENQVDMAKEGEK